MRLIGNNAQSGKLTEHASYGLVLGLNPTLNIDITSHRVLTRILYTRQV